jgi:molybdenum cofactor biosynthesis enzyme MoaA
MLPRKTTLTQLCVVSNMTGLTVVIRCPDSNNTNSTTGGMALPKFAIRGMLKTFGLHGVVLDVDSVSAAQLATLCGWSYSPVVVTFVTCVCVCVCALLR